MDTSKKQSEHPHGDKPDLGYAKNNEPAVTQSPKHDFIFGFGLHLLKNGEKVARSGWNGKGMYLFIVFPSDIKFAGDNSHWINPETKQHFPIGSFIMMKTADNKLVPWLASQTDILADDWEIVD